MNKLSGVERLSLATLATVIATLLWFALTHFPFLEHAEQWLQDYRFGVFDQPQPPHEEIVVLAIGERTLEGLPYRSPVDRGFLASLIEILNQAGVSAIGLDVLVDQPTEPEKDRRLLQVIRRSNAPLTLAWVDVDQQRRFMTQGQRQFLREFLDQSGAEPGLVNLVGLETGGVVRKMNLGLTGPDSGPPGFSVALARSVGERWIPEDPTIVFRLPPADGRDSFPVYELQPDSLGVFPPPQWLTDKIALVGAVRPYEDRHRTPLAVAFGAAQGTLPGVLLHAHVLAQILDRRSASVLKAPMVWSLCLAMAVVGALVVVVDMRVWRTVLVATGVLLVYWAGFIAVPMLGLPSLPVLGPSAAFLVTTLAAGTWAGRRERTQRRFLRHAFSCYVSPAVVESVCAQPDSLALGGERRELSFVFTDVEGFTTLSESLDPEVLGELFNQYLNGIVSLIFEYDGTLEKFVGDAVMTMFGAPLEQSDHACRALDFALAVDRWSREFESAQRERGVEFGRTRIGVNSGIATVGNFGGSLQFSYTAHGDSVNTAARLESLNKHLQTRICVGERTAQLCPDSLLRPVGELVLKGKSEALHVFEPQSEATRGYAGLTGYLAAYHLLEGHDQAAGPCFRGLRREYPLDPLVQYHCERLARDEQGVRIIMETK